MKLYKVLDKNGRSCNGGYATWYLPHKSEDGTWEAGEWMEEIEGELVPCLKGYHLCREQDLLHWLGERIYEAEYDGELVAGDDKVAVRKCRLTKRCEGWTEESARLFACWCVRHTPLTDGRVTWDLLTDKRSRAAVEVAERYARGGATAKELAAARDATRNAAWAAEGAAGAAWDAPRDAAWAAAKAVAGDAAGDAAGAAWTAAKAAAKAVAGDAAGDAAWPAARDAARDAQAEGLIRVLNGSQKEVRR